MSTYARMTRNPKTGNMEAAVWLDDHFGRRQYGVEFEDGKIYAANKFSADDIGEHRDFPEWAKERYLKTVEEQKPLVSLATKRAEKSDDNTKWSVSDCLREILRLIETGEIKPDRAIIELSTIYPDDTEKYSGFYVNCAQKEKITMLSILLQKEISEYRGKE